MILIPELAPYHSALLALVVAAVLFLIQLAVVDVVSIRRKHSPGTVPAHNPEDALFRVYRAHANTNESFSLFLALWLGAVLFSADPGVVAALAWAYTVGRLFHMGFYYANWAIARSVAFAVSLLAMAGLGFMAIWAAL